MENLDLNLLRVFNAVMQEGHVTRAAERLFLSQPAVSHALSRLRHVIQDPLFVKVPGGVRPTPRALDLAAPVQEALAQLESAINPPEFDPMTSDRIIRVATHDYLTTVLMTSLAEHLTTEAPGISVRLKPTQGRALEMLDQQEAEIAISAFGDLPERFDERTLFHDSYVCVMRPGHALADQRLTMNRFANARHLLISPKGDESGFVDEALAKAGLSRHVAMIINQFSPAPSIVARSDLLLTIPERIVSTNPHRLVVKPCPVEPSSSFTKTSAVWHRRLGQHPALHWLVETLVAIAD